MFFMMKEKEVPQIISYKSVKIGHRRESMFKSEGDLINQSSLQKIMF
jgi:hypothetical protein